MSPAAALHAQLASIMEVLANSAVAEICELVDSGYSVLQLEISRSRKENEALRRKLRLMELRTARATALRAAAAASGTARAQLPAHHPGNGTRRTGTPAGEARRSRVSDQEARKCGEADPSSDSGQDATRTVSRAARSPTGSQTTGVSTKRTATVIKIEDEEESWSRCEQEKDFCHIVNGQTAETEPPPPPPTKQEVADEGGGSSLLWMSEEVSSTSVQKPLSCSQRSETGSYDCLMFEPPPQHGALSTQSALSEDPGCSFALNASTAIDSGGEGFPFSISEQPAGLHDIQHGALPPVDESQLPARKEINERLATFARRGRWRPQGGVGREDGGSRAFVCNCCGKTLACLKNLKTHMRVHTGEKPFVCTLCGKRFSDSSNLKRHQSVHTGEKRYGCVHCGKRFAQSGSLKVHMTVHTDCKQFRCSYCGKTFISASHLRHHVAMHVGE